MSTEQLAPNSLAFIALCNEYCHALETAREAEPQEFVHSMLRLLPRLYISATDLATDGFDDADTYIVDALDEDYYDSVRRNVEMLLGEHDSYLEVFEEDMKYSDTPIAASIAEGLADLFQVLYNFIDTVRDATPDTIQGALTLVKDDFTQYWSQTLCNTLRAVNHIQDLVGEE